MTYIRGLTTGFDVRRVARVVTVCSRSVLLMAALALVHARSAHAQGPMVAALLPGDTTHKTTSAPVSKTKPASTGFAHSQLENSRVLDARIEKRFALKDLFRARGITYPAADIFMRVFKREHQLEMWVRPEGQDTYVLLKTYEICALNDKPGPKRVQGDYATPEGFYTINSFNPQSDYHLSLRVNYPNKSDVLLGNGHAMGGDVFIHGGCKTAGCMAITDENIKEVYWLAVEARDHGQSDIPVHIFPARLSDVGLQTLANYFKNRPDLVRFWSNLKGGYDYFERTHQLPTVDVNERGRYVFNKNDLLGKPVAAPAAVTAPASN